MRLLLDTHVAIWSVAQFQLLPHGARSILANNPDEIFVSSIGILEISIKHRLGKRNSPPFSGREAIGHFTEVGFQFLPVTPQHAATVGTRASLHKDPFDRLLIAQAISEPMYIVSRDAMIALYDCPSVAWQ